jgi:aspartate aminotransferase-like enzyme
MRGGLEALGLRLFTSPDGLADTLSVVRHPEGVDDAAFRGAMARRGVVVAGALGPIAGQAFRIGHMGNIGPAEVYRTLQAVESSLVDQGSHRSGAVAAARSVLE